MKKLIVILTLSVLAFGEMGCTGEAVISAQPADVVYTQPASPGADYVWVDGDWYGAAALMFIETATGPTEGAAEPG